MTSQHEPETAQTPASDYRPPTIRRLGTLAELTKGGTVGPDDGLGGGATVRSEPSPPDIVGVPLMLTVRGAQRRFGRRVIFNDLHVDVPVGARVFLSGNNGSGKTTLLRCLSGTLTLSTGQATVGGHPVGSLPARRLTGVCLTPEQGLYEKLSARENVALVARLRLPPRAVGPAVARVEAELDLTGYATVPVERCSAGMRAGSVSPVLSSPNQRCCCSTSLAGPWTRRPGCCCGRRSTDVPS
ncbi:ATP-binding cassette domain-containing protein [Micromonospora sp. M12]